MKVIDATNMIMGRLASKVAKELLKGEEIAVVNAEKAVITGNKDYIIEHYSSRRNIGSVRKGPYYPKMPDLILKRAVRGMLPMKKASGKEAYRRLIIYMGVPKQFKDVKIEEFERTKNNKLNGYITLKELSVHLGANLR